MKNPLPTVIEKYRENKAFLAELTGYSLWSVRAWFREFDDKGYRPIPNRALMILKLQKNGKRK
jgi:hypothetical protein